MNGWIGRPAGFAGGVTAFRRLFKVAPSVANVHMEDVHRAGGVMAILGELDRAGLLHNQLPTVHSETLSAALDQWDIRRTQSKTVQAVVRFFA